MIPIYLCDDAPGIRREIRRELEKEILISGYDMEIVCDSGNPREILKTLGEKRQRGIYFLDVDLKEAQYTGFTLGQEIRKTDPRGFLIYVTAYGELAFDTFRYKLEALDYIVKGNRQEMYQGIRRCLEVIEERLRREHGEERPYFGINSWIPCGIFLWMKSFFLRREKRATGLSCTASRKPWILPEVSGSWRRSWRAGLSGYTAPIWQMRIS